MMLLGFLLFEAQFIHVVSITFTALVLTELLMVALTIRTWHGLMLAAEMFSIIVYVVSLVILKDFFGKVNWIIDPHSNYKVAVVIVTV